MRPKAGLTQSEAFRGRDLYHNNSCRLSETTVSYKIVPGACRCSDVLLLACETWDEFNGGKRSPLDTCSDSKFGCLFDMCRCRLLELFFPHFSFFVQIRQRAAFRLSKRSKCLQMVLRSGRPAGRSSLPSVCVWGSAGFPWEASKIPLIAKLLSVSFTSVTVSESLSFDKTSTEKKENIVVITQLTPHVLNWNTWLQVAFREEVTL